MSTYEAVRTAQWLELRAQVGRPRLLWLQRVVVLLLDTGEAWGRTTRRRMQVWIVAMLDAAEVLARPLLPRRPGRHRMVGGRVPAAILPYVLVARSR